MILTAETARKLINLNPEPKKKIIDPEMAERQFQVILAGFNHLQQPEKNFLYIADEVGLGKTYVAIGIASLMRYFSPHPEKHTDVIIVPKENLQYKWIKEISGFIGKNYVTPDNLVKSVLNKPVAMLSNDSIKGKLTPFNSDAPSYVIYRNPSFSLSSDSDEESTKWMDSLRSNLRPEHQPLFEKICHSFRKKAPLIKHAYAYLINLETPQIDLLIVDEAHNFRHGIDGDVATRNQVASRMFGACMDDGELFEAFPELHEGLQTKVKKLLFLSATPINSRLYEIKRQLDCFLPNHPFKSFKEEDLSEDQINHALNRFLIRGLMTLKVGNKSYSRNMYRYEHRLGNVVMTEKSDPQYFTDDKAAIVMCLMQYKTIKELKQNSNNQFEMGLLAGFESFQDTESKYEEETLEHRKENHARDQSVINKTVESYLKEFSDYPPHPKQDSLVHELFELMLRQEKSLVFVRRIASVRELERKLFKKYSDHLLGLIRGIQGFRKVPALRRIIEVSETEKDRDDIERLIDLLAERIKSRFRNEIQDKFGNEGDPIREIGSGLRALYNTESEEPEVVRLKDALKTNPRRKNIPKSVQDLAVRLLFSYWSGQLILDQEGEEEEITTEEDEVKEERSPYFIQRYFYNEGKAFKKRMYSKDWFEINLLIINDSYYLFPMDKSALAEVPSLENKKTDFSRFSILRERILQAARSSSGTDSPISKEYRTKTFLTELLLGPAQKPFSQWITNQRELITGGSKIRFIEELETLNEILRSIFRQGSGMLPAFIAEALSKESEDPKETFIRKMNELLSGSFRFVLDEIFTILEDYDKIIDKTLHDKNRIRYNLIQQVPVLGVSGQHKRDVRKTAIQFRMPGYPYVLIATDILKEGEDLHSYCKNIYHYGIAWNPSDMEQRTGRIDRIDSLAYRRITRNADADPGEIPFQRKLQVFYPYLADTLEVNQMSKLFFGMNRFTDIFYNDLSTKIEKNAKVSIDELVELIPPPKEGLLVSKYDIDHFISDQHVGENYTLKVFMGTTLKELQERLRLIFDQLNAMEHFSPPDLDINTLRLFGVMRLRNNRQGPYIITVDQKELPNHFVYRMESQLGRISLLGTARNKEKLEEFLRNIREGKHKINIRRSEKNAFLWLQATGDINAPLHSTFKTLSKLIILTDSLEECLLGKDENVEFEQ